MTVAVGNKRTNFTMTPDTQQVIAEIKATTGETTTQLITRLLMTERQLITAGFAVGGKQNVK